MKKIRLKDSTELEIYNITDSGSILRIDVLNAVPTTIEQVFRNRDNLSTIRYFVETDLIKGYSGFTNLQEYTNKMSQLISVDYSALDNSTESGFVETRANIFTVTLKRVSELDRVEGQAEQNRADIDYIAMETGVNV